MTKNQVEKERLRDRAMVLMLRVREVTWDMIELKAEKDRDTSATHFDKPFKAMQEAIIKL